MKNKHLNSVIFKSAVGLITFGIIVALIGFSLSGFELEKYRTTHKEWYEVISIQSLNSGN